MKFLFLCILFNILTYNVMSQDCAALKRGAQDQITNIQSLRKDPKYSKCQSEIDRLISALRGMQGIECGNITQTNTAIKSLNAATNDFNSCIKGVSSSSSSSSSNRAADDLQNMASEISASGLKAEKESSERVKNIMTMDLSKYKDYSNEANQNFNQDTKMSETEIWEKNETNKQEQNKHSTNTKSPNIIGGPSELIFGEEDNIVVQEKKVKERLNYINDYLPELNMNSSVDAVDKNKIAPNYTQSLWYNNAFNQSIINNSKNVDIEENPIKQNDVSLLREAPLIGSVIRLSDNLKNKYQNIKQELKKYNFLPIFCPAEFGKAGAKTFGRAFSDVINDIDRKGNQEKYGPAQMLISDHGWKTMEE